MLRTNLGETRLEDIEVLPDWNILDTKTGGTATSP